jgi:hypothetical protein
MNLTLALALRELLVWEQFTEVERVDVFIILLDFAVLTKRINKTNWVKVLLFSILCIPFQFLPYKNYRRLDFRTGDISVQKKTDDFIIVVLIWIRSIACNIYVGILRWIVDYFIKSYTLKPPSGDKCPICWDKYLSKSANLNCCGHEFHPKCIEQWLSKGPNRECPICRQKVD